MQVFRLGRKLSIFCFVKCDPDGIFKVPVSPPTNLSPLILVAGRGRIMGWRSFRTHVWDLPHQWERDHGLGCICLQGEFLGEAFFLVDLLLWGFWKCWIWRLFEFQDCMYIHLKLKLPPFLDAFKWFCFHHFPCVFPGSSSFQLRCDAGTWRPSWRKDLCNWKFVEALWRLVGCQGAV